MRLEAGDPLAAEYLVRVYLNGCEVPYVAMADEESREIEALSPGPDRKGPIVDATGEHILTENLHGEVKIVLEELP